MHIIALFHHAPGLFLYLQVVARDDDYGLNGQMSYTLSGGNDDGSFSLTSSGQLRLEKLLDREIQDHYELIVIAIDSGETICFP